MKMTVAFGDTFTHTGRNWRMSNAAPERQGTKLDGEVLEWLLDSDPAIRWQVMRDLAHEPEEVVASERARVATEGWGARLLRLQAPDGQWGGGAYAPKWTSTTFTLLLLRDLGLAPKSEEARRAVGLVRDKVIWGTEFGDAPFFDGETEPCINGRILTLGAYFGEPSEQLLDRLLGEQLEDGGWNCEAPPSVRTSFDTTICVLEGLLEYEKAAGATPAVTEARIRAQEYLLERRMFRKLSTGEVVDPTYLLLSFPARWYDVLWGLDYLRSAGAKPDKRAAEAVALVEQKRRSDGRWPREDPFPGQVHFDMDGEPGEPSRWNTLRALRVLDWYAARD